jgi:hypothetical protein
MTRGFTMAIPRIFCPPLLRAITILQRIITVCLPPPAPALATLYQEKKQRKPASVGPVYRTSPPEIAVFSQDYFM